MAHLRTPYRLTILQVHISC